MSEPQRSTASLTAFAEWERADMAATSADLLVARIQSELAEARKAARSARKAEAAAMARYEATPYYAEEAAV